MVTRLKSVWVITKHFHQWIFCIMFYKLQENDYCPANFVVPSNTVFIFVKTCKCNMHENPVFHTYSRTNMWALMVLRQDMKKDNVFLVLRINIYRYDRGLITNTTANVFHIKLELLNTWLTIYCFPLNILENNRIQDFKQVILLIWEF